MISRSKVVASLDFFLRGPGEWCRGKSDRVHAPTAVVTDRVERMRRSPTTEYNLKFHRLKSQCDLRGESI